MTSFPILRALQSLLEPILEVSGHLDDIYCLLTIFQGRTLYDKLTSIAKSEFQDNSGDVLKNIITGILHEIRISMASIKAKVLNLIRERMAEIKATFRDFLDKESLTDTSPAEDVIGDICHDLIDQMDEEARRLMKNPIINDPELAPVATSVKNNSLATPYLSTLDTTTANNSTNITSTAGQVVCNKRDRPIEDVGGQPAKKQKLGKKIGVDIVGRHWRRNGLSFSKKL